MKKLSIAVVAALGALGAVASSAQAAAPTCTQAWNAVYNRSTNVSNEVRFAASDTAFRENGNWSPGDCFRNLTGEETEVSLIASGNNWFGAGNPEIVRLRAVVGDTDAFISCSQGGVTTTYRYPIKGSVTYSHRHFDGYLHIGSWPTGCE